MEFIGFIFIIILGTLSHFTYEWSHHNKLLAYFVAVNESTWEHIKMAIGPNILWILISVLFIGNNNNFLIAKFASLFLMVVTIPLFFYGYSAILKRHILIVDILIFFIAVFIGQYVSNLILNISALPSILNYFSLVGIVLIFILYMTKTFLPDKNFLYKDPITNNYGLKGHSHEDNHE